MIDFNPEEDKLLSEKINKKNLEDKYSPLVEFASKLWEKKINGPDENGLTPLMHKFFSGNTINTLEELIKEGANVNATTQAEEKSEFSINKYYYHRSPLSTAVENKNKDGIRILMEKGATIDTKSLETLKEKYQEILEKSLSQDEKKDSDAIIQGLNFVEMKQNTRVKSESDTQEPINARQYSFFFKKTHINRIWTKELLHMVLDENFKKLFTERHPEYPVQKVIAVIIKDLLNEKMVNLDRRDENGSSALHCAAQIGIILGMEELIIGGADVNARDKNQKTPLHYLATSKLSPNEAKKIVDLLLIKGADLDAKDKDDNTAYQIAINNKNTDLANAIYNSSLAGSYEVIPSPSPRTNKSLSHEHVSPPERNKGCALQ